MFTIQRCVLMLLFITVCSKARNAPEGGSRQLEEVATRRELGPMPGSGPYWGSCEGTCGGKTNNGECWCDAVCSSYGDCCYDYNQLCAEANKPATNSCQGFCGQKSPDNCWCDAQCTKFNDCCPDEWYYCHYPNGRRELGSEEDNQPTRGDLRRLEEVATRGDVKQFEKNDNTAPSNFPTLNPTDLPSSIPTESPTDSPQSNTPTDSSIVGTGIEFDGIMFDISFQQRILDAIQRQEHAGESIQGQNTEEFSKRRQLELYGTCTWNKCGGQGEGSCWCDEYCEKLGDCCEDYIDHCSCQGSCNGQADSSCWCDSLCWYFEDCCPDYAICESSWRRELGGIEEIATREELEESDITATSNFPSSQPTDLPTDSPIVNTDVAYDGITFDVPQERVLDALQRRQHAAEFIQGNIEVEYDVDERQHMAEFMREVQMEAESSQRRQLLWGSCVSNCGGPSDGSCWCDNSCQSLGDCCPDYEVVCNIPIAPKSSCKDSCDGKSKSGNCWCDGACVQYGDCCDDYTSQCGDGSDVGSCYNACNSIQGSYPNICWCDSMCTAMGDCCYDYDNHCARRELGEEENTERNGRRNLEAARKLLKML